MNPLPLPPKPPFWELAAFRATREEARVLLGQPHYTETGTMRTSGGEEDIWAYALPSGQRLLIIHHVPYQGATLCADPPDLGPVLEALHISPSDSRLVRYPEPKVLV